MFYAYILESLAMPGEFYRGHTDDLRRRVAGHGDYDMLFGHYRTLMTKDEAERIFALTPEVVLKGN